MSKDKHILVSEFTSNDQNRIAVVYDHLGTGRYWIHCIDKANPEKCHIIPFDLEESLTKVEDIAEDWVSD